ncbi:hypothetical protein C8J56DRAFT_884697 [Mycena floridula]|nr:hypothetical protein C8J56DRAFT_884697 [Mycena floridula]
MEGIFLQFSRHLVGKRDSSTYLCSWKQFPANPVLIAVCPTNYIENQFEQTLRKFNLVGLVINAETYEAALTDKTNPINLWTRAEHDLQVSMLIISPEQLASESFKQLLKNEGYWTRIIALGVDEVHLVIPWGAQFHQPFQQIAHARARLPDTAVVIALTATMRAGAPFRSVCKFLSIQENDFHLIRRSNLRPDIQMVYRELKSGLGGRHFPELDWILPSGRTVVLFCRTIRTSTAYRYWRDIDTATQRIRTYNSLNWTTFNDATRELAEKSECAVVVSTTTIAVGVDLASVQDVVIFGEPADADELFQMLGRIHIKYDGLPSDARGIVYFLPKARVRAEKALMKLQSKPTGAQVLEKDAANAMDPSLALLFLAPCKVDEQDRMYGNPSESDSKPCSCPTCQKFPHTPRHVPCDCSGCMVDFTPPMTARDTTKPADSSLPPKGKCLTRILKKHGKARFRALRLQLYRGAPFKSNHALPPTIYLPDGDINSILDHFALISSVEQLKQYVNLDNSRVSTNLTPIYELIVALGAEFAQLREQRKAELKAAKEAKEAGKKIEKPQVVVSDSDSDDGETQDEDDEDYE